MAIAELSREMYAAEDAASEGPGKVRVAVHDASRLEWSLSVPLPESSDPSMYSMRVEIQIPQNAFVRHVPWDQMQAFARLDGPAMTAASDIVTIDNLRRATIAMANQLSRASDGFQRHCRLAASLFATTPHSELEDALTIWIETAVATVGEARERLTRGDDSEPTELTRERTLVDEFLSVRLVEMLASAERALSNITESRSPHAARLGSVITSVEDRLASAMSDELTYRTAHRFVNADPTSPHALERYLDRASRLKKHFQEVLFLEQETFQIAERAHHWIAGFVALIASTWAFAWQLALANQQRTNATAVGSGVIMVALLAGVVYATKDRLKEVGRSWVTRRVHRAWGAERITRYRAPHRRLPGRDIVVSARESFNQSVCRVPDSFNPGCDATTAMTVLSYESRGEVFPNAKLVASGVRRVKHVFRYDLSPLFARLDDATKPVPILDGETRRVRFIDAPRCYRLPVTVEISSGTETYTERATLVMHKRGLERLEREDRDSDPAIETGIEPSE